MMSCNFSILWTFQYLRIFISIFIIPTFSNVKIRSSTETSNRRPLAYDGKAIHKSTIGSNVENIIIERILVLFWSGLLLFEIWINSFCVRKIWNKVVDIYFNRMTNDNSRLFIVNSVRTSTGGKILIET